MNRDMSKQPALSPSALLPLRLEPGLLLRLARS